MRKKERNRILFVVAVGGDSSGACSRSDKTPTAAPRQKKKKKKKGVETRGTCERLMTREKMVTTFFWFFHSSFCFFDGQIVWDQSRRRALTHGRMWAHTDTFTSEKKKMRNTFF
jgi:hypothetical protein